MCLKIVFLLGFVTVLFAFCAFAVPAPPTGLSAEFVEHGIKISWQHSGGTGISFKVYRGETLETAKPIANMGELFFVDKTIVVDKNYFYFVTVVDESGESNHQGSVFVEAIVSKEKPFSVRLVEPAEKIVDLGAEDKLDFVLALESKDFSALGDLKAVLVNTDFGTRQDFVFDAQKHEFFLSAKLPQKQPLQAMQTTYTILVTAVVDGKLVSESRDVEIAFVPPPEKPDVSVLAQNFFSLIWRVILALFVAGTIAFVLWKWSLYKKEAKRKNELKISELRFELGEIPKARERLNFELLKHRISETIYHEEMRRLQMRQGEIDKEIKLLEKGIIAKKDPLADCNSEEKSNILMLVQKMRPQKSQHTKESMSALLLGQGWSEKVAKKVTEIVFEK